MSIWPLRFRELEEGRVLFTDDSGAFFQSDPEFLDRYANADLSSKDGAFLSAAGHSFQAEADSAWTAFAYRWSRRQTRAGDLSYVILVPTLRCNLACGYCQVSRAAEMAPGHDWTESTLQAVLQFLGSLDTDRVKVEFQGGEPLLRLDLLERVRRFCRERFQNSQFVVCTNLQRLDERHWAFLEASDTFVSTSFDGDAETHQRQRTHRDDETNQFLANLRMALSRLGPERVSALPTIDPARLPKPLAILQGFADLGLRSIYLRPINHQGFARKTHAVSTALPAWHAFHSGFIDELIAWNAAGKLPMEEYYFTQCLRRVFRAGVDDHMDLRNPNFFASEYVVVDHDGRFYPSDEARMVSRVGVIDLSIGDVWQGLDLDKIAILNSHSLNNFEPDCIHCVYQPFCGSDVVDDLSRYGRIDVPRSDTWFCQRQTAVFDKVFEVIYRDDAAARQSVAAWLGIPEWSRDMLRTHQ